MQVYVTWKSGFDEKERRDNVEHLISEFDRFRSVLKQIATDSKYQQAAHVAKEALKEKPTDGV